MTAPLGYPSSYPVEGADTSSGLTASGPHYHFFLWHIFIPHFADQVPTINFCFIFSSSYCGLSRKPVLCKLPNRIWTIRLWAAIRRHWQVCLDSEDFIWENIDFYVDIIFVMTHRLDASLFTFPMVITAFFSAMMGGLLAPLVVNVAARWLKSI